MEKLTYQERRAAKLERFKNLSNKFTVESSQLWQNANRLADMIPFGQPILVGHHSEGRHRNHLTKTDNLRRKSIEVEEKAEYYAGRVESMENNNIISSDDPEAIEKLKAKVAGLEKNQEFMKAANKIIKSKKLAEVQKVDELVKMGLSQNQAIEIMSPKKFGGPGYASFSLTNNNANLKRCKDRIAELEKKASQETQELVIGDVKVIDNVEENRFQMFFPGKPSDEIRTQLKRSGFRWSPSNGCWQSFRNNHSKRQGLEIANSLNKPA